MPAIDRKDITQHRVFEDIVAEFANAIGDEFGFVASLYQCKTAEHENVIADLHADIEADTSESLMKLISIIKPNMGLREDTERKGIIIDHIAESLLDIKSQLPHISPELAKEFNLLIGQNEDVGAVRDRVERVLLTVQKTMLESPAKGMQL